MPDLSSYSSPQFFSLFTRHRVVRNGRSEERSLRKLRTHGLKCGIPVLFFFHSLKQILRSQCIMSRGECQGREKGLFLSLFFQQACRVYQKRRSNVQTQTQMIIHSKSLKLPLCHTPTSTQLIHIHRRSMTDKFF